jgi:hypothetical protein
MLNSAVFDPRPNASVKTTAVLNPRADKSKPAVRLRFTVYITVGDCLPLPFGVYFLRSLFTSAVITCPCSYPDSLSAASRYASRTSPVIVREAATAISTCDSS